MPDPTPNVPPNQAPTPTDPPKPGPKPKAVRPDQSVPGGAFIEGGEPREDEKHYGGRVVNADGEVLAEFDDDEVNDGKPRPKKAAPKADDRNTQPTTPPRGK